MQEARQLEIHVSIFSLLVLSQTLWNRKCRVIKLSSIRSFERRNRFALVLVKCGANNRSVSYFDIGFARIRLEGKSVLHPVFVVPLSVQPLSAKGAVARGIIASEYR